jgi:hypothetical protein
MQTCLTWLSLALRFGPEGEREASKSSICSSNSVVAAHRCQRGDEIDETNLATQAYD